MKTIFYLYACFVFAAPQLRAADFSAITNNLFIGVEGWRQQSGIMESNPVRFDDELVWRPFCITGRVELLYPNPPHGINIKMWDAEGKDIQKTILGKTYGSKWNQLHSYKDGYLEHMGFIIADQVKYDPPGDFTGVGLPRLCDLFEIEKPGTYTLEIQMQMFCNPGSSDTNRWSHSLFGFPPIKIKVEKSSEK